MAKQLDYTLLTKVTQQDLNEGVWDAEHKGLYSKDGKRFLQYMTTATHLIQRLLI